MSLPISIGLELEFLVAYVQEYEDIDIMDSRTLKFGLPPGNMYLEGDTVRLQDMQQLVHGDIAKEFYKFGLPVDVDNPASEDFSLWQMVDDSSVNPDGVDEEDFDPSRRREVGVEAKSPILPFSNESLQIIEDVCLLLNSKYHVRNNRSTGLHVHIGHFPEAFTLTSIKKLAAFLYTFEHQLSSLHPAERLSAWCNSMREICNYTSRFQRRYGSPPTPSTFVAAVMGNSDRSEVLYMLKDFDESKSMQYHFGRQEDDVEYCRTIEFRQHAGSTDGKAATNWIRVIAGIMRFCEDGHPLAFIDLLTRAHSAEKLEYMRDNKDEEQRRKHDPILAYHGFTVIDLLVYLGLPDQAVYYQHFWSHEPEYCTFAQTPAVVWEYENMDEGSDEYEEAKARREQWDSLRIVQEAREVAGLSPLFSFDPDDPIWPAHSIAPPRSSETPVNWQYYNADDLGGTGESQEW